mmetsp:Transcript_16931/g.64470  ORF Transcript_16931/g.64470 Transcript_16931/m.64470 type:complete len:203 (+) Transcript_16931:2178-2786(+)
MTLEDDLGTSSSSFSSSVQLRAASWWRRRRLSLARFLLGAGCTSSRNVAGRSFTGTASTLLPSSLAEAMGVGLRAWFIFASTSSSPNWAKTRSTKASSLSLRAAMMFSTISASGTPDSRSILPRSASSSRYVETCAWFLWSSTTALAELRLGIGVGGLARACALGGRPFAGFSTRLWQSFPECPGSRQTAQMPFISSRTGGS